MSWERRTRGGLYYTRSKKVLGRVVREYVGCGRLAKCAALSDAERRAKRKAEADAWLAERTNLERADAALYTLCDTSEALVRGSLILAGYYQHHRGEWRKRRAKIDCSDE